MSTDTPEDLHAREARALRAWAALTATGGLLALADAADRWGITVSTLRAYRGRHALPDRAARIASSDVWLAAELNYWRAAIDRPTRSDAPGLDGVDAQDLISARRRARRAWRTITDTGGVLGRADVARHLEVKPGTVGGYLKRPGYFPDPIGDVGRSPVWLAATVDRWRATERPRGRPKNPT